MSTETASELRAKGCVCEFGCRNCGMSRAQMSNCPAWDPCPMGRALVAECPLHASAGDACQHRYPDRTRCTLSADAHDMPGMHSMDGDS